MHTTENQAMAIITINTRKYFVDAETVEFKPVSNGRWEVTYNGSRTFTVVGGIKSGGAAHEWFVHHPEFFGDVWVPRNSMIAAIRTGIAY